LYNTLSSGISIAIIALFLLALAYPTGRFEGDNFIDIGAGPCIASTLVASKYYKNILLAEYAPANRVAIQKWRDGTADAHDWSGFAKHIAELEGNE
jgi:nicotinamide N-methyltransferase